MCAVRLRTVLQRLRHSEFACLLAHARTTAIRSGKPSTLSLLGLQCFAPHEARRRRQRMSQARKTRTAPLLGRRGSARDHEQRTNQIPKANLLDGVNQSTRAAAHRVGSEKKEFESWCRPSCSQRRVRTTCQRPRSKQRCASVCVATPLCCGARARHDCGQSREWEFGRRAARSGPRRIRTAVAVARRRAHNDLNRDSGGEQRTAAQFVQGRDWQCQ